MTTKIIQGDCFEEMNKLNNPIYNLVKDFYYKYYCFRNTPHKWNKDYVETEYRGINMKFLLYKFPKQKAYNSKYLNENLIILHKEMSGYFQGRDLKEGDYVVDCGAYNGVFSIYASKIIGDKGKVICFEPDEFNAVILEKNLKLNNCKNCIIIKKGLSDKEGIVKFKSGGIGARISEEGDVEVKITTIDLELDKLNIPKERINFIKSDIEGAEIEMIDGANETLKSKPYIAIASYHIVKGEKTFKECERKLKSRGYEVKTGYPDHLTTYGL
jgi:FkbM family methyltransferase